MFAMSTDSALPLRCLPGRRAARASAVAIALAMVCPLVATPATRGLVWLSAQDDPAAASAKVDPGLDRSASGRMPIIVQAAAGQEAAAAAAVRGAGGEVGKVIPLIDGFEAQVAGNVVDDVAASPAVRAITGNRAGAFTQLKYNEDSIASSFPVSTTATGAWRTGNLGGGVGVAVLDTGVTAVGDLAGRVVQGPDLSGEGDPAVDSFGHGTVMAGLIAGSGAGSADSAGGAHVGMAPAARVISVKTAGANGVADVSTVLQGMHWVSAYAGSLDIRVLSLAWGAPSTQSPALDPLNYAVERLWKQGIVVVVAAGNSGPGPSTVSKPGDDPMVITVGAYDDRGDADPGNDSVPAWSSQGPTAEGVSKPDLVAPGRTLISTRSPGSTIERENPTALVGSSYVKGSGTSQAAAVTSGAAALLLAANPSYTPDQVKKVLKGTAAPLPGAGPNLAGAGRLQLEPALSAPPGPAQWQKSPANGLGSLEASRGGRHVKTSCFGVTVVIIGEMTDRCQLWNAKAWTGNSWTGNSWTGNSWTGNSWTGNSWTGNSWTGNSWTGNSWTGNSWTGNSWTGSSWTGNSWTGNSWTGNSWTGSSWSTAFWGDTPDASQCVPGEALVS
jgi:serine protease AprX